MIIREFYEGVDPDDPVICMGTDSFGRFARLNNWYNVPLIGGEGAIHRAMGDLLSGKTSQASFIITVKIAMTKKLVTSDRKQVWTRTGHETVRVGDKDIDAVVYELYVEGQPSPEINWIDSNLQPRDLRLKWKLLYDPLTGIFLKADLLGANQLPRWKHRKVTALSDEAPEATVASLLPTNQKRAALDRKRPKLS